MYLKTHKLYNPLKVRLDLILHFICLISRLANPPSLFFLVKLCCLSNFIRPTVILDAKYFELLVRILRADQKKFKLEISIGETYLVFFWYTSPTLPLSSFAFCLAHMILAFLWEGEREREYTISMYRSWITWAHSSVSRYRFFFSLNTHKHINTRTKNQCKAFGQCRNGSEKGRGIKLPPTRLQLSGTELAI